MEVRCRLHACRFVTGGLRTLRSVDAVITPLPRSEPKEQMALRVQARRSSIHCWQCATIDRITVGRAPPIEVARLSCAALRDKAGRRPVAQPDTRYLTASSTPSTSHRLIALLDLYAANLIATRLLLYLDSNSGRLKPSQLGRSTSIARSTPYTDCVG